MNLLTGRCLKMSYLQANSSVVYFENQGSGEALVFLHSLGTSSKIWEQQKKYFENDYQVICIDARGHGSSESTIPFSFKDWANDIVAVLDNLEIKKAHFVGLSMGGHVLLELYQIAPNRISSIILCNTFAKVPEEIREEKLHSRLVLLEQDNFVEEWAKLSLYPHAPKTLIEKTINLYASSKDDYKSTWIAVNKVNYVSMLKTINIPVLILTGDMDKAAPIKLAQVFHENIEGSKLEIIRQAGHFSNLCNPAEFNLKISSFLSSISK